MKDEETGQGDMTPERLREMRERCKRATRTVSDALAGWDNLSAAAAPRMAVVLRDVVSILQDLPAALAWGERLTAEAAETAGRYERATQERIEREDARVAALEEERDAAHAEIERLTADVDVLESKLADSQGEHGRLTAEIERLTAELAACATADASVQRLCGAARALLTGSDESNPGAWDDLRAALAAAECQKAPADASLEARAKYAATVYDSCGNDATDSSDEQAWIAVVRAVDASRPGLTERDAADIELARAVRDTLRETTHDGAIERLEELLDVEKEAAARPGLTEEQAREIAADVAASFNARWSIGLGQGPLKDMADRIEAGVLRASRGTTGLTEEQARRDFEAAIRDAVAKGGAYCNTHAREAVAALDAALLRAARGETGPGPTGLTRGLDGKLYSVVACGHEECAPATCDVEEVPPDPRATLHAGDPASLADVVAASAREPHADVVLQALHVSGGAAAVDAIRKVALNPNGTIREQDAHRVEQALRAAGIEATVDRGHNVLADGAVKLTPREP